MNASPAEERAKKAQEDEELHERLCSAIALRQVEVYTDQRMLDFQGSPVHNGWDHLAPLLILMLLALAVLLATGVAFGIVAMTFGALGHLLGIKYFVAWRIRSRAKAYLQCSARHLQQLWQLGGVALVMMGSNEPPCLAPRGDWRRFVRRNLLLATPTAAPADAAEPMTPGESDPLVVEDASSRQEILPP